MNFNALGNIKLAIFSFVDFLQHEKGNNDNASKNKKKIFIQFQMIHCNKNVHVKQVIVQLHDNALFSGIYAHLQL